MPFDLVIKANGGRPSNQAHGMLRLKGGHHSVGGHHAGIVQGFRAEPLPPPIRRDLFSVWSPGPPPDWYAMNLSSFFCIAWMSAFIA